MSVRRFKRKTAAGNVSSGWMVDVVFTNLDGVTERYRRHPRRQTRSDALALEQKLLRWLEDRDVRLKNNRSPSLKDFSKEFLTSYVQVHNKPSEVHSKSLILKNHLLPFFGEFKLTDLGSRSVDAYKAQCLGLSLSPKTINNHLAVLRRMLSLAEEYGLVQKKLTIKALRVTKPVTKVLKEDQADALLSVLSWPWQGMALTALHAGLRLGELLALRWREVDLKNGRLTVCRNNWRGVISTPKGHLSRKIPLSEALRQIFESQCTLQPDVRGSEKLVFSRDNEQALTYQQCRRPLINACERASIPAIQWHSLRHSFASHLVMRGASLRVIQELLGHSTQAMTERYAHLTPEACSSAISLLNRP